MQFVEQGMREKMNNIAAIVVTYNRIELLKECMDSLKAQSYDKFDIIIVDNCSTDGTENYIRSKLRNGDTKLKYIRLEKNTGGAGGFYHGIKKATEEGYERIWLMDDDTIPEEICLEKLVEADHQMKGEFSFLASFVEWVDGQPCQMNMSSSQIITKEDFAWAKQGYLYWDHASFVSLYIDTDMVRKYGLPIKEFFIWYDDFEYTLRLSQQKRGYCVLESTVIHKMKNNQEIDIIHDEPERLFRYKYSIRNEFYMRRKSGVTAVVKFLGKCMKNILLVICCPNKGKWKKISIIVGSFMKGIFFHPKIEFCTADTRE